jgi:hypothetical protein
MGVVAEHLKKKLTESVRSGGLLIWLDREHQYTALVDSWMAEGPSGSFPYEVFAYRGSFLELMASSRKTLSGQDNPRCVIHMPGFNETDMKETPLLESYKAGQRWRISLDTLIRESARGRLSQDQVEYLLAREDLSLEVAEEYVYKEEKVPLEVKQLLQKYGEEGLVLRFIEAPQETTREMCVDQKHGFQLLTEYLLTLIGLDYQWGVDWNQNFEEYYGGDSQVELLLAYCMAMEFVHDLKGDARSERLSRLGEKPKEYVKISRAILRKLRESKPELYIRWAERVESNLTEQEQEHTPDELGSLDTFRFEADIFLKEAMSLLQRRQWTEAMKLAAVRLPGGTNDSVTRSFWLEQNRTRLWLWQWVEAASKLGTMTDEVAADQRILAHDALDHTSFIDKYRSLWWKMDYAHRRFSSLTEKYQSTHSDLHIKAFVEIRMALNTMYRNTLDTQAGLWNDTCRNRGFLPEPQLRQRNFFERFIAPLVRDKKKLAILFVDALRYELGLQLSREMEDVCPKQEIVPLLAELPTITSVGMNALIPVSVKETMSPLYDDRGSISGFKGGERQVRTYKDRQKTMDEWTGVASEWVSLSNFLALDEKKLGKLATKNILVLTALDIDKMGESGALGFGLDYFENGLARLKTAILKLKNLGYEEFLITSDHGFLLGDDSLKTGIASRLQNVERRFAYDTPRESEQLTSADPRHLGYEAAERPGSFIFSRNTHILNGTRQAFYHGGNSLQERLIPVIALKFTRSLPNTTGTFELQISRKTGVLGYHRITLVPKSRENLLFSLSTIDLLMTAEEGAVVEIGDVSPGKRIGDLVSIPVERECEILFKLNGGSSSKVRISFVSHRRETTLIGSECGEYFEVDHVEEASPGETPTLSKKAGTPFSDEIPEEYHAALDHLYKHGSLTETYLVNTLGGDKIAARKARRFASYIDQWLTHIPFNITVEKTSEGQVYRKVKG